MQFDLLPEIERAAQLLGVCAFEAQALLTEREAALVAGGGERGAGQDDGRYAVIQAASSAPGQPRSERLRAILLGRDRAALRPSRPGLRAIASAILSRRGPFRRADRRGWSVRVFPPPSRGPWPVREVDWRVSEFFREDIGHNAWLANATCAPWLAVCH